MSFLNDYLNVSTIFVLSKKKMSQQFRGNEWKDSSGKPIPPKLEKEIIQIYI